MKPRNYMDRQTTFKVAKCLQEADTENTSTPALIKLVQEQTGFQLSGSKQLLDLLRDLEKPTPKFSRRPNAGGVKSALGASKAVRVVAQCVRDLYEQLGVAVPEKLSLVLKSAAIPADAIEPRHENNGSL